MKTGIELIAEERQRQIDVEGWSQKHDDEHHANDLPLAAAAFAEHVGGRQWLIGTDMADDYLDDEAPDCWPWKESAWKPKDPLRDLVRAGALIAAAIDRLQRLGPNSGIKPSGEATSA